MKISVIIPTYKPLDYLWECLDSLENQTFSKKDFEVILVLNGCNEPYKNNIEDYIQKHIDLNINFIQTDSGGVSNARNIALNVIRGEYITFIDDDDYVSPSYLEEMYKKSSPNTIVLSYPYSFIDGNPSIQIPCEISKVYKHLSVKGKQKYYKLRKYFSGPWMKLIPRDYVQGKKFDIRFKNGEDSLFMFLISDKFNYIDFTSDKAIYYRRHRKNSAISAYKNSSYRLRNSVLLFIEYTKIYFSNPFKYNMFFYITRLMATIRSLLIKH